MNLPDMRIQISIGPGSCTRRTTAPLAIACARYAKHPTQAAHTVVVALPHNPGLLHRDPFAKYAVAFRKISTSSLALASSLRSRLFSASRSVGDRRTGPLSADSIDSLPSAIRLRRNQLLHVAVGMPSRQAALCPPTESASRTASTLNSSVYCLSGTVSSIISTSMYIEINRFLLYVEPGKVSLNT